MQELILSLQCVYKLIDALRGKPISWVGVVPLEVVNKINLFLELKGVAEALVELRHIHILNFDHALSV